jgi:hypothetical protein
MAEIDIKDLVRQSPFSFVGTIEHLGAASSGDLPIDERTAVVRVELVLHAPGSFQQLEGQRVTVQLAADTDPPAVGEQLAIFAEGLAFGETVAVAEIARAPVEAIAPYAAEGAEAAAAGDVFAPRPFAGLERELAAEALREHVDHADAVVVGTVVALEEAATPGYSEHDPLWWRATIDVRNVVRGPLEPGPLGVLYPNSLDVAWARVPKPKASQEALWILHRTEGEVAELGEYQLLHEDDRQPVAALANVVDEDG